MANRFAEAIRLVLETAAAHDVRVALIGGFALPFLGVVRPTADVDFLVDTHGGDPIHAALLAAGERCLQRTAEVANYESTRSEIAPVDLLFAHRPRALAILARARPFSLPLGSLRVPVADAEGMIGLKVQAIATNRARVDRDRDDVRELLIAQRGELDLELVRDYFRLFELEPELDRMLAELDWKIE